MKWKSTLETLINQQFEIPVTYRNLLDYKKNMFALLGKPGFEDLAKDLNSRL